MNQEPSNGEILSAVKDLTVTVHDLAVNMNEFASQTEIRFQRIEHTLATKMVTKEELDDRFAKFEVRMVSKSYLDEKLADHHRNLVQLFRKEMAQARK